MRLIALLILLGTLAFRAPACTIVVLTDAKSTLFCNNEDWSDPVTRLWFEPAGTNRFGCIYVGFDNGWAQGGMNSEGLALDWVAGGNFDYVLDPKLRHVRGNASQRMLESCRTVDEAIEFYQTHREASFSRARILVADRSGASAIIGARDGQVYFERSKISRGFGFGEASLRDALGAKPAATIKDGIRILRACAQSGTYSTKYSNIFDLKTGDIYIFAANGAGEGTKLNLQQELSKGAHYYDIPNLADQIVAAPRPLLRSMRRLPLDAYRTIADHSPEVTARIRSTLERSARGPMQEGDFSPEFWKQVRQDEESIRAQLRALGTLLTITRVETDPNDSNRMHRYRIDFDYATVLVGYVLDQENRIASIITEDLEQKSK